MSSCDVFSKEKENKEIEKEDKQSKLIICITLPFSLCAFSYIVLMITIAHTSHNEDKSAKDEEKSNESDTKKVPDQVSDEAVYGKSVSFLFITFLVILKLGFSII